MELFAIFADLIWIIAVIWSLCRLAEGLVWVAEDHQLLKRRLERIEKEHGLR